MQSAEEFIQGLLREKAELSHLLHQSILQFHQRFFTKDIVKILNDGHNLRENKPEVYVSAIITGISEEVITLDPSMGKNRQIHNRYHLNLSGEKWQVFRKESQCSSCHGSGQRQNDVCTACRGLGWIDYARLVA